MPKINAAGVPSYAGHEGTVTNAVGEQFELNRTDDEQEPDSGEVRPIAGDQNDDERGEQSRPVDEPKRSQPVGKPSTRK